MSDDPVRTRVTLVGGPEISFQEYFVRRRHAVAVESVRFEGADECTPAPGVLEAMAPAPRPWSSARRIPSSPSVPSWPCRGSPTPSGERRAEVVAVSPIVAGAALRVRRTG